MREGGIAAQFTLMKARADRGDRLWIARATSSFPVPVSPVISTVESVGATLDTCASTRSDRRRDADDFLEHRGLVDLFPKREVLFAHPVFHLLAIVDVGRRGE